MFDVESAEPSLYFMLLPRLEGGIGEEEGGAN